MRALAVALGVVALATPAAGASSDAKIVFFHGKSGTILYLSGSNPRTFRQPLAVAKGGTPRLSGDGRLVSIGGYVVGRIRLPATTLVWAPTGETAAYVTKGGGVGIWTPTRTRQVAVPDGWGAQGVAWSSDGALAIGRAVCSGACGLPTHTEVWIWRRGSLHKLVGTDGGRPNPFAWHNGRVLWWDWPNSASIAADGVAVYENGRRIAGALMYPDYVAVCGTHLAIAAGGDRYSTHGKRILFDGRDVSRDTTRSWVSPSCQSGGGLVASASANTVPNRLGREHRAIWQLLPARRQLTHPPVGWTDEFPHLLADGSVFFIRTHQDSFRRDGAWWSTTRARLELLRSGKLTHLMALGFSEPALGNAWLSNYYGHYDWPSLLAVAP